MKISELDKNNLLSTNDIVTGDTILFSEAVFEGSFRNPKYVGDRTILCKIIKDSYGSEKQQHTFTLEVFDVEGISTDEILNKKTIRRKGRNIYKNGVLRMLWNDENEREKVAEGKHRRGSAAREERRLRRLNQSDEFDIFK